MLDSACHPSGMSTLSLDTLVSVLPRHELLALRAVVEARLAGPPATDVVTPLPRETPCKVYIARDRQKWRVLLVDRVTRKRQSHGLYLTREAAEADAPRLVREYRRPVGVPMPEALTAYRAYLTAKGNRPRSVDSTMFRVESVVGDVAGLTGDLTTAAFREAWDKFVATVSRFTKQPPSVDTQHNTLSETRSFFRWCSRKGWLTAEPAGGIEIIGRRRRGKPQLTGVDESRKFLAKALELGATGDVGAIASAVALLMGMRASEITDRVVRDLDDQGRILIIGSAKTEAGIRRLRVPDDLVPVLNNLVVGKAPDDRIFGDHDRQWLRKATIRVCAAAGVKRVTPHGLRGTHASLAVEAGVAGVAVAASLGHESFEGVTARHYASASSVCDVRTEKVASALDPASARS